MFYSNNSLVKMISIIAIRINRKDGNVLCDQGAIANFRKALFKRSSKSSFIHTHIPKYFTKYVRYSK